MTTLRNSTYRYMMTRLLIPLMVAAAVSFAAAFPCPEPWRSLLVNLTAAFVGSVVTVFFVDAVLKRQKQAEWEAVRLRTNRRLARVGHAGIATIRQTLQIEAKDVFPLNETPDLVYMHSESIRMAEALLPTRIERLYDLDQEGWKILTVNLQNLCVNCDQLLALFGRDLEAEITRLLLDIQSTAEGATGAYTIFPDLMGVPEERLPRKRDGSSCVPTRNAWTKLTCDNLSGLCGLCADLLRRLPPLDTK